jgi:hypothetical protein
MSLFVLVFLIVQKVIFLNIDNYSMLHEYLHLKNEDLYSEKWFFGITIFSSILNPLFEQQEENYQLLMEFVDTRNKTSTL